MTNKLENLIEQHDLLKEHPFRLSNDEKYLVNYAKEFKSFYANVYDYLKDGRSYSEAYDNDKNFQAISNMYHDFLKTISDLYYRCKDISKERKTNIILYLERVLGSIHFYLDNRYFKSYYTLHITLFNDDFTYEYRYSKRNKWTLYMSKEKIKNNLDYCFSKPHDNNIYEVMIEYFQDLYDNYEKNWE